MTAPQTRTFGYACLALQYAIVRACRPLNGLPGGYVPYWGRPDEMAIYYAKHVIREARRLGLVPTTAQLDAETRRAA